MRSRTSTVKGFTLFELIIVLMIITAMVTIAIPYATRSNKTLKMEEECRNIAEAVKYATDLAINAKRPIRIAVDPKENSYLLEMATTMAGQDYEPIEDIGGTVRYLGRDIRITDITGFSIEGRYQRLVFDPTRAWPNASISLSTGDAIKTIHIKGKQVEIEDSAI
jgi:prepilin-type N-terminal cleavage/methylation domain-containing protein